MWIRFFQSLVIEDGMKNAGFQDCWIHFIRASLIMSQFMKNSLLQTVVLHQIGLWQQEHSKQLPSQKGSQTPVFIFVHQTFVMFMADK